MENKILIIYLFLSILSAYTTTAKNTFVQLLSPPTEFSQVSFLSNNTGYLMKNLNNGTTLITNFPQKEPIISINQYESIDFETPLTLDSTNIDFCMTYQDTHFEYDGQEQWSMIYLDDFQGAALGWSKEKLSTCGSNDNMFLGGHCNFGGEEVSKNYTSLKKHTMVRITANFHFFDQWEGEEAFMFFNGKPVWTDSYKWCDKVMVWYCKKYGINACGAEYPDRLSVPIDFMTYHNESEFQLSFGGYHNKSACTASWGIDDVTVYIK